MRPLNLVCVSGDGLLHPERRITGAHGMILMRERRAEEGHNPVAHNPVARCPRSGGPPRSCVRAQGRRSFCASSGSRSASNSIEPLISANSTVTCLRSPSRAALDGEDLVGKVLGRVTLGRGKAGIVRNRLQRMATLGAELGCGRHLASTIGTDSRQRSSTLLAELRLSGVLVLAFRAFHRRPRKKKRAGCAASVTSRMMDNKAHVPFP